MKAKLSGCLGIVILAAILICNPFKSEERSPFGEALASMGKHQEEMSEQITNAAVAPIEESVTGGHEVDGSNWAIPNIFLHLISGT